MRRAALHLGLLRLPFSSAAWLPPPAAAGTVGARASRRGLCGAPLRLASPAHPSQSVQARPPLRLGAGTRQAPPPTLPPRVGRLKAALAENLSDSPCGGTRAHAPHLGSTAPSSGWAPNVPTCPQKKSRQPSLPRPVLGRNVEPKLPARRRAEQGRRPQFTRRTRNPSVERKGRLSVLPELPSLRQTLHWISVGVRGLVPRGPPPTSFSLQHYCRTQPPPPRPIPPRINLEPSTAKGKGAFKSLEPVPSQPRP